SEDGLGIAGQADEPAQLRRWLRRRFGENVRVLGLGVAEGQPLPFLDRGFLHLLSPHQDPDRGVATVTFRWSIATLEQPTLLTFRMQDPLDPRREIMSVDCVAEEPGVYELTLDFPDQVFLPADPDTTALIYGMPLAPPPRLWLTVGAGDRVTLDGLRIEIGRIPRAEALPQASAWRKLLLKGQFSVMSEPRPWMRLFTELEKPGVDGTTIYIRAWLDELSGSGSRGRRYRHGLESLFETVEQCRLLAPDDEVIRQYHEWIFQAITRTRPWQVALPEVPGAPRWAVLLHQAWLGARRIPAWWIENRLSVESGELGERVNDDTDMLQQWASYPFVEDSPLGRSIRDAGGKLAELALRLYLSDDHLNIFRHSPHHSYEEGINQLATNAWWNYGDPVHLERAMRAADSIRGLTVQAGCGHRHFPGTRIQALDLHSSPAAETAGNTLPLLLHPAYEVAWYNRNPAALDFYAQWADAWIEHQEPGRYATDIDVETGNVVGARADAVGHGGYRTQGMAWLGIYEITGDRRFLKPFLTAVDAGDRAMLPHYAADFVYAKPFRDHLRETGKMDLFPGYAHYVATGDTGRLEEELVRALAESQRFEHMYTAAEPYTDRVFTYPFRAVFNSYLGSFTARNIFPHNLAVSYEGLGQTFAALVGPADARSLRIRFYNFAKGPAEGRMRVWRLEHGRYRVRVGRDVEGDGTIDDVIREEELTLHRFAPIDLTLPPGQSTVVDIEQIERADDLLERADLALSPLDSSYEEFATWQYASMLRVRVHNIGARAAENINVSLLRGGERVHHVVLKRIEAPLDLEPRVVEVHFPDAEVGDEVVVDPDHTISEIAEHNNRLVIRASGLAWPPE
ncbi:TPA: hypothetical protein DCE37_20860, partial [Candidatus Latescibacteria bacterium]|nr:hypothetical protein [Candidatus Latescibacterota bacterium]